MPLLNASNARLSKGQPGSTNRLRLARVVGDERVEVLHNRHRGREVDRVERAQVRLVEVASENCQLPVEWNQREAPAVALAESRYTRQVWGSFLLGGVLQGRQLQLLAGFLFAGGLLIALIARAPAPEPSLSFLGDSGEVRAERAYGELPLSFERDAGRSGPQVDFIARTPVGTSYIGAEGATLALGDKQRTEALRFRLSGAASPEPRALERLPGEANYLVGDDPSRWRTEIPAFERIRYANVYPGVSIDWHGS